MDDLAHQAIQAAISGEWKQAQRLNRLILKTSPDDIESILRLANALSQLGKVKESRHWYEQALKIDHHNIFAQKGILRVKKLKGVQMTNGQHTLSNAFLEEPGKTKTTTLTHPSFAEVLARVDSGEQVQLTPRRRRISITTSDGTYIGRLPDDLSLKLLMFIRGGNKYEAIVKSISNDQVKIFIREVHRAPKFDTIPSFSADAGSAVIMDSA